MICTQMRPGHLSICVLDGSQRSEEIVKNILNCAFQCGFFFCCCCLVVCFFLVFCFFLRSPAISLGFTTFGWDFCVCDRFFNPTIKVVTFRLRGWCVLGVFFVAGIHPSRTWTSGSFESVRWNACMHRLDLGLYSHPKEFLGEWSLNPC